MSSLVPTMLDTPGKKRSLFGSFNLFSRTAGTPTTTETETARNKLEPVTPSTFLAPRVESVAPPESPPKRASEAVMQTRKIISRPQGPSSRLNQTTSATDFTRLSTPNKPTTNFASSTSTFRRMPGDNPHRFSSQVGTATSSFDNPHRFSGQVGNATSNFRATTSFSGLPTTPRVNFEAPASVRRPAVGFSPRVPTSLIKGSFPPSTPGKTTKASVADASGHSFSHSQTPSAGSIELFNKRIPSPPRHLTGEFLAKEVPNTHDRPGSIYADEFLAHYCPPDFNDLERRQFFCILDLRRLKYAADEIFLKRDWKINILNFAKEYEKSRSLIMLRYGLYEFKTVRASQAVTDEWKKMHGITPDQDESPSALQPTTNHDGGGKRKAEEQLTPADSVNVAASPLKRARATDRQPLSESSVSVSNKNKRRMDIDDVEENQPSKLQKYTPQAQQKAPPSATKSIFEKIANNTATGASASPTKPANKVGLSNNVGKMPNGFGGSVFDSGAKSMPANSIFGHLSDNSKGSGNDDADAEGEDETGSEGGEEPESDEVQEVSSRNHAGAAATGGVATPQLGGAFPKPAAITQDKPALFAKADDAGQSRSIFDRLTYGNNGQPVRQLSQVGEGKAAQSASLEKEKPASPLKDQSTGKGDQTWNTDTPIKFAAPSTSQSGSVFSPEPTQNLFGASSFKKAENAVSQPPKPAEATEEKSQFAPSATSPFSSKPNTPFAPIGDLGAKSSGFGASNKAEEKDTKNVAASAPGVMFGAPAAKPAGSESKAEQSDEKKHDGVAATTTQSLFGVTPKPSTADEPVAPKPSFFPPSAPIAPATSAFGETPKEAGTDAVKPQIFQSATLFGNVAKSKTPEALFSQPTPLFGAAKPAEASTSSTSAAPSLFASQNAMPTSNLFGMSSTPAAPSRSETDEPAAKKPAFGATSSQATPSPMFGFGKPPAVSTFGVDKPAPVSDNKPLFGGLATPPALMTSLAETEKPKFHFGGLESANGPKPVATSSFVFGQPDASKPAQEAKPLFGQADTSKPAAEAKPLFGQVDASIKPAATSIFANPTNGSTAAAAPSSSIFQFASQNTNATPLSTAAPATAQLNTPSFGSNVSSSFTFGGKGAGFNNPFAANGGSSAPPSFNFGNNSNASASTTSATPFVFSSAKVNEPSAASFTFGAGASGGAGTQAPSISFGNASGAATTPASQPANMFGAAASGTDGSNSNNMFSFGGAATQPNSSGFSMQKPPAAPNMFSGGLAPGGGTSTGTNTPFTFGGASSLATTPAAGTPEPSAGADPEDGGDGKQADGDDAPQEQISLIEGGPGEEDESVVHEVVRAKAIKLVLKGDKDSDDESSSKDEKDKDKDKDAKKKSPWKVCGVGPLRILKHKTTGVVRMLMRAEPRGHIVLNRGVLPDFSYKAESKYVKLTTSNADGTGLETWMLQVKTEAVAQGLAAALEANKGASKKN